MNQKTPPIIEGVLDEILLLDPLGFKNHLDQDQMDLNLNY